MKKLLPLSLFFVGLQSNSAALIRQSRTNLSPIISRAYYNLDLRKLAYSGQSLLSNKISRCVKKSVTEISEQTSNESAEMDIFLSPKKSEGRRKRVGYSKHLITLPDTQYDRAVSYATNKGISTSSVIEKALSGLFGISEIDDKGFNFIELFAGAGGFSEGFIRAGFNPIAHVEMNKDACDTLRTRAAYHYLKGNAKESVYYDYLKSKERDPEELWDQLPSAILNGIINEQISSETIASIFKQIDKSLHNRSVDVIIGGPPCQAYSVAGRARDKKGMRDDPRNYLYLHYMEFLKKYNPKVFVFENVPGILSASNGEFLNKIFQAANEAGYELSLPPNKYLNAKDFGVLQDRKRVLIIGWKKGLNLAFPTFFKQYPRHSINDLFTDLSPLKQGEELNAASLYTKAPSKYLQESGIRDESNSFVTQHIARNTNPNDQEIYRIAIDALKKGKNLKYSELPKEFQKHSNTKGFCNRFKVVDGKGLSHCLVARISRDGHYYIHPDANQNRSITPREAARIQSFPDNYFFEGERTSVFKQIGNAVPPLMSEGIAKQVRALLFRISEIEYNKQTVMDMFCGAGGFSEGFRQQGYDIVHGVDNWRPAIETFNANFDLKMDTKDILDFEQSIEDIENLPNTDLIIGSPCCQSFSSSNKQGKADKGMSMRLIKSFLRVIAVKKYQPNSTLKGWVMENVKGSIPFVEGVYTFADLNLSEWAEEHGKDAKSEALWVNPLVLSSDIYGVPQRRVRAFFGEMEGKPLVSPPATHKRDGEVWNLPLAPSLGSVIRKNLTSDQLASVAFSETQLESSKKRKMHSEIYGKMPLFEDLERPARTILATVAKGARETHIIDHFGIPRTLTEEERATIMGFPSTFIFVGARTTKNRLIGNAVCPPVAAAIAKQMRCFESF